jgi:hydrogenase maturation protease
MGSPPRPRSAPGETSGLDLSYALLDGYEAVVLVDAAPRGGAPGTLYLLEIDASTIAPADGSLCFEMHTLEPVKVLRMAAAMGGRVRRLFLLGCEPTSAGTVEEMHSELSEPVRAVVDEAVDLVASLVPRLLGGERIEMCGDHGFTTEEIEKCRS